MYSKQETQENAPSKEEATCIEGENEAEEEVPFFYLSNYYIKPDMFDWIHILDEAIEKIDGTPTFQKISGFPVFITGQPTEDAMVAIIQQSQIRKGK